MTEKQIKRFESVIKGEPSPDKLLGKCESCNEPFSEADLFPEDSELTARCTFCNEPFNDADISPTVESFEDEEDLEYIEN